MTSILAVLQVPGEDPPAAAVYPANPDGTPPAVITVSRPDITPQRGPVPGNRVPVRVGMTDTYRLTATAAPTINDLASAATGTAWPGLAQPGDPGPAADSTQAVYVYRFVTSAPVWS